MATSSGSRPASRPGRERRCARSRSRTRFVVVYEAPGSLTLWDIAPDGRVLLTRDEERRAIVGVAPGSTTERDVSWLDQSGVADLSPDGRWLLGNDRFWRLHPGTNGSAQKFLDWKEGFADAISPDGKLAIGTARTKGHLVLIPTGVGEPHPLPAHDLTRFGGARWFPDGKRILFTGAPPDRPWRSYVQDASGGAPRALTPEGIYGLAISSDRIAAVGPVPTLASRSGPTTASCSTTCRARRQRTGRSPSPPMDDRCGSSGAEKSRAMLPARRGHRPAPVMEDARTARQGRCLLHHRVRDHARRPVGSLYSYTRLLSQLYLVHGLK